MTSRTKGEGFARQQPEIGGGGLPSVPLVFFLADRAVEGVGGRTGGEAAGLLLALGSVLDGIPGAVLGLP